MTVVGMGRTAMGLVRLLCAKEARPCISEIADGPHLEPFKDELAERGVAFECGGHRDAAFEGASLVIPSPGVSPQIEPIRRAVASGIPITSEIEFAYAYCPCPILAVTGTNGKTTTTELLRDLIAGCGSSVLLAGNNALPFSEAVLEDPAPDYMVLEVSSYQLELIERFRPWIGAVLNVTPDHLSRHHTLEAYSAVKQRLFMNLGANDHAVFNAGDERVRAMAPSQTAGPGEDLPTEWAFSVEGRLESGVWVDDCEIRYGDERIANTADIALLGKHNLENALAALAMMRAGGFAWADVTRGLAQFRGIEHRIEHVATIDGADFYNDSKSTNFASMKAALESFSRPVVLIAGGRGKGDDFSLVEPAITEGVTTLIAIGEEARNLRKALHGKIKTKGAKDMKDAVLKAAGAIRRGDVVLLSPGCASFDMYDSFEERGRVFKECVKVLERCRDIGERM